MRLLLKLNAMKTVSQEHFFKGYFTAMHGLLAPVAGKDEKYSKFCFGNLFPVSNQKIEQGRDYSVIISSSNPLIIEKLFFYFEENKVVEIGELQFTLKEKVIMPVKLSPTSTIESISPVNITTHNGGKIKFHRFGDENFLELLRKNMLKKCQFLTGTAGPENLFENVEISAHKKHPFSCFQINFFNKGKNENFKVCGSKLVFRLKGVSDEQLKVFQTLFDAGIGERTSFGAGFMIKGGVDD